MTQLQKNNIAMFVHRTKNSNTLLLLGKIR